MGGGEKLHTFVIPPCESPGYVHIHCVLVVHYPSNVTHRGVNDQLLFFAQLPSLLGVCIGERARVIEPRRGSDFEVASTRDVDFRTLLKVCSPEVSVQGDPAVTFSLRQSNLFPGSKVLHSIGKQVRVRVPKDKRAEFDNGDESRKVQDFIVGIPTVENTRKVEKLCPLIYLCPEPFLQNLFCVSEGRCLLDQVEVGEHTDDFWETVGLQDIEEFKRFLACTTIILCKTH